MRVLVTGASGLIGSALCDALLARGDGNKHVARELGISLNAVKRHVGSILAKLGASNRAVAVAHAYKDGLL